jgi:hypothetical protein
VRRKKACFSLVVLFSSSLNNAGAGLCRFFGEKIEILWNLLYNKLYFSQRYAFCNQWFSDRQMMGEHDE